MILQVSVRNNLDKSKDLDLPVEQLSFLERAKLAAKILALCWGAAFLCIFIPVLHFVLVPLAILIGIFMAYRQLNFHFQMKSAEILCPNCEAKFESDKNSFNWPKIENCRKCESSLLIDIKK
jgi:hypothetical protein